MTVCLHSPSSPSGTRWWYRMTKDPVHHGIIWSLLGSPNTPAKACSSPGQGHCRPAGTPVLHKQLWWGVCVWWFRSNCQQQGIYLFALVWYLWCTAYCKKYPFYDIASAAWCSDVSVIFSFCTRTWNQQHPWTTSGAMTSGGATWVATPVTNPTDLSLSLHLGKGTYLLCELTHLRYTMVTKMTYFWSAGRC